MREDGEGKLARRVRGVAEREDRAAPPLSERTPVSGSETIELLMTMAVQLRECAGESRSERATRARGNMR